MAPTPKNKPAKDVSTLRHRDRRTHIPPAEMEALLSDDDRAAIRMAYERRNPDFDPQLVWRGKAEGDLNVVAPPLYIQEKVHPKVLIDDLMKQAKDRRTDDAPDLFGDFNGLPDAEARAEFYAHDANWTNRMILGDSLQVMASLAEKEGLRGKVQCIYLDPPYGIKFNSNFQWSTTSRDVKDGNAGHITREPEMVKAFRDTWRDGIHSYLGYLRDRLTVARDLLTESGSCFVQIGDENVHRVRAVMDEVFGEGNFISQITVYKTTGAGSPAIATSVLPSVADYVLWFAKNSSDVKYRRPYFERQPSMDGNYRLVRENGVDFRSLTKEELSVVDSLNSELQVCSPNPLTSQTGAPTTTFSFTIKGKAYRPGKGGWKTNLSGFNRLQKADRLLGIGNTLRFIRYFKDFSHQAHNNIWQDLRQSGFGAEKTYVVQTAPGVVARCLLMATDPGDLVLDPTCGSGTTAYVAEQWGRRWITIDTSRVALALARARIMGARYPWYITRDSEAGGRKEADLRRLPPSEDRLAEVTAKGHRADIHQGFVYERVPHITLKSIANNAEIDVIWEKHQTALEPLRADLNQALGETWEEWQIPRDANEDWPETAKKLHGEWWEARITRQAEIDASIAAKADHEYLYDKPYEDRTKVRVAGPFTVESISPHRTLAVGVDDELIDPAEAVTADAQAAESAPDYVSVMLDTLAKSGVQQMDREDRITFDSLEPWAGRYLCAEGRYREGEDGPVRRAGIFIGPEFGTVQRADLTAAARECAEAGCDILIACAFSYSGQCSDLGSVGRVRILRARMNPDLHMSGELANTGAGNLFVVFGEPDIEVTEDGGDVRVRVKGVDVFKPQSGEIVSHGPDGIACWFIDTDYNEESFFVRHAYFLGANDPYKALKTTLKAEIDEEAWDSLHSDTSRPFPKPSTGRIAVKVINHLGDEVMKVFAVN